MAISGGDGSIVLTTKVDESGLSSGLSKLKSGVGAFGKAFAVAGAAGVAAFAGITKAAVDSYAEYEQLKGGVETLFKDSANTLMKYADQAYKTSGMSANQYMEGVTSFSASMIASVGGDTAKAAELSNQAMISISDNANKMGTDMESIIMTYQSLARGNVGMLDNLKLGYGGTKAELERLIADAEAYKASMGEIVDYDASNFADVTQAIQAIQEKLDISGATAEEASTTIQGSAMAMKASWQNLLTGMADPTQNFEQLLQNFISSVGTFLGNLLPVFTTATQGVLQMVQGLLPQIPVLIEQMLPIVIEGVSGIIAGLVQVLPQIVNAVIKILPQIVTAILNMLPQILEAGIQILLSLIQGLTQALPQLIAMLPEIINTIITVLIGNLPLIIEAGIQLLIAVIEGLAQAIPQLIDYVPTIVDTIITTLLQNLPLIIDCAIQLLVAIITGLIQALPQLATMTPQIIITIVTTLIANLPQLLKAGVQLLESIIQGISSILSKMGEVGKNIVQGLWQGIINTKNWLLNKIKSFAHTITDGIKSFFGIHSPSTVMRDEVGKQIPAGMAIGIDKAKNLVTKATKALVTDTRSETKKLLDENNSEMLYLERKYADESARIEREKAEKEYREKISNAKTEEEIEKIKNEQLLKEQEKSQKEYLDNLKWQSEQERKFFEAKQKDIENLKKNIVDAYSEMANEVLSSIEDLEKEQQNLEQKLAEYGGLMVEKTKKIWGKEVTYNVLADLDEQKETLQSYYDMLQTVKERGNVPKEFFNVLREMGVDEGLEYANALLELSDEDFAEYIKDWEEKQKLSQDISKALYEEEAQQLADEIGNKFDEVEKEFFGVGENSADEFEDGFMEQLQTVIKNIKRTISGAFSGIAPDANYGIGGYSINVPALARGSVLPGGKPFLAIVNDQPRGQTNVEAPLQTIVDAFNIALNNRGGSEIIREEHYNLNETELMTILHKLVKGGERLQGKSLISGGAY